MSLSSHPCTEALQRLSWQIILADKGTGAADLDNRELLIQLRKVPAGPPTSACESFAAVSSNPPHTKPKAGSNSFSAAIVLQLDLNCGPKIWRAAGGVRKAETKPISFCVTLPKGKRLNSFAATSKQYAKRPNSVAMFSLWGGGWE